MGDLEDLIEDIKVYVELEQGQNVDYWRDITIICEEELNKLKKLDPNNLGLSSLLYIWQGFRFSVLDTDSVSERWLVTLGHVNWRVCFTSWYFPNPISQPGKKHTEKKQDDIRLNSLCNNICIVIHIYI